MALLSQNKGLFQIELFLVKTHKDLFLLQTAFHTSELNG